MFRWSAPFAAARSSHWTSSRCRASVSFASPSATASFEAAHERLRGRAPAEVLLPLPRRLTDALLLLLDIGHLGKRPAARGPGDGSNPAPYAALVEDAERQRQERRLERDRRRREQGKPTYFESDAALDSRPVAQDPSERSTAIIRPRRDPDRGELIELEALALDEEGLAAQTVGAPPSAARPREPEGESRSLARSGVIFAVATGASRVLGLVREIVAAAICSGSAGPINAFKIAFLIPNTVRSLVADSALSAAFVPVFSDLLVKGERKRAWRVASSIFWLMLLGLGGLTALFIVIAPWVMGFSATGRTTSARSRRALARILFPLRVVILGLTGIVVGILNSYDHFTVPALSPVAWNLDHPPRPRARRAEHTSSRVDEALLLRRRDPRRDDRPVPAAPALAARARRPAAHAVIDIHDPAVKRTFVLMVPVTIGLGLININAVIDQLFATHYLNPNIAPTAIVQRLSALHAAAGSVLGRGSDRPLPAPVPARVAPGLGRIQGTPSATGLRLIAFCSLPASAAAAILGDPDRPAPLSARRLSPRADADRGRVPRSIRARSHVQRDDADDEPRLLLAPVAVDPELGRARKPRRERRARRRVLPVRDLGDPALDVDREHRGDGGAARALPAQDGRLRYARDDSDLPPRSGRISCARRSWRGGSGTGSTRGSASRSRRRSSPSAQRSCSGTPPSSECAVCSACASWRRCCACAARAPDQAGSSASPDRAASPATWVGR